MEPPIDPELEPGFDEPEELLPPMLEELLPLDEPELPDEPRPLRPLD